MNYKIGNSIFTIKTGYNSLYLFYNDKKPGWKKKPFRLIGPHQIFTYEFLELDYDSIFYKEGENGEILPLNNYEYWLVYNKDTV